jgi:hypothetical protein
MGVGIRTPGGRIPILLRSGRKEPSTGRTGIVPEFWQGDSYNTGGTFGALHVHDSKNTSSGGVQRSITIKFTIRNAGTYKTLLAGSSQELTAVGSFLPGRNTFPIRRIF